MMTAYCVLATRAVVGSGRSPEATTASRPEVERLDAVGEDLPVERLGIDLEERGRLAAMAVYLTQGVDDVLPLHRFEARPGAASRRRRRFARHFRRQVTGLDLVTRRQDHRALDGVEQLAHVAGPRVALDRRERARAEMLLSVGRVRLDEMLREKRDVVGPVAQRWERHGDRVDAVVQVLAELAGAHRLRE